MRVSTRARKALHAELRPPAPRSDEPSQGDNLPRAGRIARQWLFPMMLAALATSITILFVRNYLDVDSRAKGARTEAVGAADLAPPPHTSRTPVRLIGATATITEVSSGLPFAARVDTGATTCAIHCEKLEIKNPNRDPKKNVGKPIRFLVKNSEGQSKWVQSKIVDHVTVRNAAVDEERYKVELKFRWRDLEKLVAVTLDNRRKMSYPLLLGRNFLSDDFLVNVSLRAKR
jgi:hypothetical protein